MGGVLYANVCASTSLLLLLLSYTHVVKFLAITGLIFSHFHTWHVNLSSLIIYQYNVLTILNVRISSFEIDNISSSSSLICGLFFTTTLLFFIGVIGICDGNM